VLLELGPIPSPAVRAWINYARETIHHMRGANTTDLPPRVFDAFSSLLDEWDAVARAEPVFRWTTEESPEQVAYLLEWLYRFGVQVEDQAETGAVHLRPPEADKFHVLLVRTVLETLAREEPSQSLFVEEMRRRWKVARPDQGS
jgi:hypothetical protein